MAHQKTRIGITMGDVNGIGMEIILKAFSDPRLFSQCVPVLYSTPAVFKFYKNLLNLESPMYKIVNNEKELVDDKINLRICSDKEYKIKPGEATKEGGELALAALNMAVEDIKSGLIQNLVTAPIDKNNMQQAGFKFQGHTDFLADAFEVNEHLMLLVSEDLKVGLATEHLPLADVSKALTQEKIVAKIQMMRHSLIQDFGIQYPKIAVLGLNPHAGDRGTLGQEEAELILPAIQTADERHSFLMGPYPADGFFGSNQLEQFDAVLAMYHDQGLIPFKMNAFHTGVNYTAGLPMVRTSPDHGTAYAIAGKGTADPTSFLHAIYTVNDIYRNRLMHMELKKDPLPISEKRKEKFSIGVPNLK